MGPVTEIRKRDSYRRHARGLEAAAVHPAEGAGAESVRPLQGQRRFRPVGPRKPLSLDRRHRGAAEDVHEAVDEISRGIAVLQRGAPVRPAGKSLRGSEELPGGDGVRQGVCPGVFETRADYANLGYDNEAEQSSRRAVDRSDNLPPQERYLVLANHARILNDNQKAIESYENLVKVAPEDPEVHFNLAALYEAVGSFDKARDHYLKVLARDPNYVEALFGVGQTEMRRGNPQGALDYLTRAQTLAVQSENDEARANVLNAIGTAYRMLSKPDEALRYYQQSLDIKRRIGQKRGMALTLGEMAMLQSRSASLTSR